MKKTLLLTLFCSLSLMAGSDDTFLLRGGTVMTIWPMFGIANQLLGTVALAIGTTYILRHSAKRVYALVTGIPCAVLTVTIMAAGVNSQPSSPKGPLRDRRR